MDRERTRHNWRRAEDIEDYFSSRYGNVDSFWQTILGRVPSPLPRPGVDDPRRKLTRQRTGSDAQGGCIIWIDFREGSYYLTLTGREYRVYHRRCQVP